jgi:serine/threonine-protein kinase
VDGPSPERARWQRVERIFDEASELPPDEVEAYLDRACADLPEARREVEELLAASRALGEGFLSPALDRGLAAALGRERGAAPGAAAPDRVGAWRLVRPLGEGGMGRVFLAERADGAFEQRAAVKLLKPGLVERGGVARFLRERQILARLDHPGIARLLDGGLAADGTPFFVLEHVEGEPITSWCAARDADLGARLRLFGSVCAAVAAAHRSLVVHRDLKPSNILVTAEGAVKLLDFGIAKPLEQADETRTVERALTPEYAAPEQIVGGGVTTATDVYALGVLLYELLTGRVPHPWTADAGLFEFQRRIVAEEPARPGALAAGSGLRVGRDLEAIVLKALRKEPGARYATVEALAADVERHLAGRPVAARGGARTYRARKFVLRHRLALAAAAVVVLALAGGLVATAWQARRARAEAAKSRGIADFLIGLFTANDPYQAKGEERTARQLLDLGARRVESELAREPEVQAAVYGQIAAVYAELGEFAAAERLAEKLLALEERVHGPHSAEAVGARILAANQASELGRLQEAEREFRAALEIETAERGADTRQAADALRGIAGALGALARYEEAEAAERRALAILRATDGETGDLPLTVLNNLAIIVAQRGRLDEGERLQREHIGLLERRFGSDAMETLTSRYNLAATVLGRGRYAEAESLFSAVVPDLRKVLGPRHHVLCKALQRQARALDLLGRTGESAPLLSEASAIAAANGVEVEIAAQRMWVAFHALETGAPGLAESEARAAGEYFERAVGPDNDYTAWTRATRARALAAQGRLVEARTLIEAALAALHRTLGPEHSSTLYFEGERGAILLALGAREEAARALEATASAQRRAFPDGHPDLVQTLVTWADALDPATGGERRRAVLEEALELARRFLPAAHPRLRAIESRLLEPGGPAAVRSPGSARD